MSASKSFLKNAVGILLVVAICLVAVNIYKKGNTSINNSLSEYDAIVSQFDNAKLSNYENSTVSGSQIIDLIKSLKEADGVSIVVFNGYTLENKMKAQEYDYSVIHAEGSTVFQDITDRTSVRRYINPRASFVSSVVYDENNEISSVVFEQK